MFPRLFVLAALLAAVLPLRADAGASIPFRYSDGMIWLEVAVAGHEKPLNFLLDSGASATVIDLSAARSLGLPFGATVPVQGVHARTTAFEVPNFAAAVGAARLSRTVLALDLAPVSAGCGHRIQGLVGADFFRGKIVRVDFGANRLLLIDPSANVEESGVQLPICWRNDAMCVEGSIGGFPSRWMRVDTGCNSPVQFVPHDSKTNQRLATSVGLETGGIRYARMEVRLGAIRLPQVRVGLHRDSIFPGESGLLGAELLGQFKAVTFDGTRNLLILAKR